ncbi:MAG: DUF6660 family protein [Bacteroidia bacterium]
MLYLLFAIYIFGLSLTTCTDGVDNNGCGKVNAQIQTSNNESQHHQDENCSPFCVCSCCSGAIITKVGFTLVVSPLATERLLFATPQFNSADYSSIWQPPKIA